MEKEFVPYGLAVKLKAIGFDEPCIKYIYKGDTGNNVDRYEETLLSKAENYNSDSLCVSQPTFSQAFRWFREKGYLSYIEVFNDGKYDYTNVSNYFAEEVDYNDGPFDTYEEAELACLEKLIEIISQTN
jgi:hypothetical protein